jgi:hypothetical protein
VEGTMVHAALTEGRVLHAAPRAELPHRPG